MEQRYWQGDLRAANCGGVIAGVRNPLIIEDDDRVDGVDYRAVEEDWDSMDELFAGIGSDDIELVGAALCVGSILLKPAHSTRIEELTACSQKFVFGICHAPRPDDFLKQEDHRPSILGAAQQGLANHEAISAAKAVEGLVRQLATYASKGVRINCVARVWRERVCPRELHRIRAR